MWSLQIKWGESGVGKEMSGVYFDSRGCVMGKSGARGGVRLEKVSRRRKRIRTGEILAKRKNKEE